MRWKLARIAQIDVFLHWTFFLAPAYLIYQWRDNDLPWSLIAVLLGLLVAVFACVLMHEYGHALMARHFGVATRDIIITPIGGLARLERMPRKPLEELMITIAGPAVNLGLALIFAIYILATGGNWVPATQGVQGLLEFSTVLMWMNLVLFLFNLIPAFPMDGGRILRSSLAFFLTHRQATLVAGILGQICALAFMGFGWVSGEYSLILVGAFVFFAGRHEIKMGRSRGPLQESTLTETLP